MIMIMIMTKGGGEGRGGKGGRVDPYTWKNGTPAGWGPEGWEFFFPPGFHTTAREPKRERFRAPALQTPPIFNEKTPQQKEATMTIVEGEGKKERNYGWSWGGGSWRGPLSTPPPSIYIQIIIIVITDNNKNLIIF